MQSFYPMLVLMLASCNSQTVTQPIENSHGDTAIIKEQVSEYLHMDTLVQNGLRLIQIRKDDRPLSLFAISGDTIIKNADYYHSISFPDIDGDGYKDIRVTVISNTPNQCENYFFDEQTGQFRRIENSDLDIAKLKGTGLFYSYNRAGCADMNWESHLSRIENWKEVNIGLINAKGCGDADDGIFIYKVQNNSKTLIEKLRIDSAIKGPDKKWAFIKKYWANNYKKFQE